MGARRPGDQRPTFNDEPSNQPVNPIAPCAIHL
jgi:hypothetical protein